MNVIVFGMGYVGLTCALGYATNGHNVIGVDIDIERVANIRNGIMPFNEPELDIVLERLMTNRVEGQGTIEFTTKPEQAIYGSDISVICVGTPENPDGTLDVVGLRNCVELVTEHCPPSYEIVIRSTVPVGTTRSLVSVVSKLKDVRFSFAPEFFQEGQAWYNFCAPQRTIIGCDGDHPLLANVLVPQGPDVAIFMGIESAELTKLASNAMLATRLSFMNEVAFVADKVGADVLEVLYGMGTDSRIGDKYLTPGVGWGGACLPKDTRQLYTTLTSLDPGRASKSVLGASLAVNELQVQHVVDKVKDRYGDLNGVSLAVWGVAFKDGVDDTRESQAQKIITKLASEGASIKAFDPNNAIVDYDPNVEQVGTTAESVLNADGLLILTHELIFRGEDFTSIAMLMKQKVIFDFTNLCVLLARTDNNFEYHSIGRTTRIR